MDLAIQDHFAITAATYQPARGTLPTVAEGNQNVQFLRTKNTALGRTILLPMPNEIVDRNSVSWGSGKIGSVTGAVFGPIADRLTSDKDFKNPLEGVKQEEILDRLGAIAGGAITGGLDFGGEMLSRAGQVASQPFVRRKFLLDAVASAAGLLQVNVDVGQVLQRSGVVENPNLELLFNAPDLRTFGFNLHFTKKQTRKYNRKIDHTRI